MLKVIFTLDYEIHGNGEGSPYTLMIDPTARMMDLFGKYGAKLTIMADVAEVLKFKEYKERSGRDDYNYDAIANQLREAVQRGHDVQLHLHPSYFNAQHEGGRWLQDWSEYNFATLPPERLDEVVKIGKKYLEDLLKPVVPTYQCIAFRAANWAMSPSKNAVRALINHGIRIDTSVFKHGFRKGIVNFDYSNANSDLVPWFADENDICQRNDSSQLLEIPIYAEQRRIGAFLTVNRLRRAYLTRKYSCRGADGGDARSVNGKPSQSRRRTSAVTKAFRRHAWKADFNQCTGKQLVRALERAEQKKGAVEIDLPFVLIGHSKLFTRSNGRTLTPFLSFVSERTTRFGFAFLRDFDRQKGVRNGNSN